MCLGPASPLHLHVDKIPAVLWATDQHFRITSLAGAGLKTMDVLTEDYVGRPVDEFWTTSASDATPLLAHVRALSGGTCVFDISMRGRDLKGHVEPLREANGDIVGVIGVALDNTDYRVAERALRLSEQSYRSLFEEAPYGICRSTSGGQLLQVNRAVVEMLGCHSEEDLLLRDLKDIFAEANKYQDFMNQIVQTTSCQGFECAWRHQEGPQLQVRLGGRAVRDEQGETLYVEILAENVTERKKLEEQLQQGQKMQAIGQLAGGIAHDFNNILTVIKGHVEQMLSDSGAESAHGRSLWQVKKAADRASMLTQRLLAFSRRQILKTRVLDLNQVIGGATQMLERLIGDHIELVFMPVEQLGAVRADQGQIEQLLMNLIVNARDAIRESGTITIRTANISLSATSVRHGVITAAGNYAAITISDTGDGMDEETRAHIFEPFFTTKKDKGTGLGLATVYGVIKQSGGYIWVHSEPGQGTTFEIYLPTVAEPPESRTEPVSARSAGGNETVLLVEDEPSVRDLIAASLRGKGYHVLTAGNGARALELAESFKGEIDLLVSDLCMPVMGGKDLADELKKTRSSLEVIFISGYPGDSVVRNPAANLGAPVLQKPFNMRYLATAVRCILDGMEIPPAEAQ